MAVSILAWLPVNRLNIINIPEPYISRGVKFIDIHEKMVDLNSKTRTQ